MIVNGQLCAWCNGPIPADARKDSVYCCKSHRQAAHRFGKAIAVRERAAHSLRIAYADPPYPGLSKRYYRHHRDYAGEVDHRELLLRLQAFDGWALSTSMDALPLILDLCHELDIDPLIAAWFRGCRPGRSSAPRSAWEPVVYVRARSVPRDDEQQDALVFESHARTTDPARVIGSKPAAFCSWMFGLIGAAPNDDFCDLYPGSGGVGRAWKVYASREYSGDASPRGRVDASPRGRVDASSRAARNPSREPGCDASPSPAVDVSGLQDENASHPPGADTSQLEAMDASTAGDSRRMETA